MMCWGSWTMCCMRSKHLSCRNLEMLFLEKRVEGPPHFNLQVSRGELLLFFSSQWSLLRSQRKGEKGMLGLYSMPSLFWAFETLSDKWW